MALNATHATFERVGHDERTAGENVFDLRRHRRIHSQRRAVDAPGRDTRQAARASGVGPADLFDRSDRFDVDAPAAALPLPDLNAMRALSLHVQPLFAGPRLSLLSAEMLLAELSGHTQVQFSFDYSLSLDSNIANDIRRYVFGQALESKARFRVVEFLRVKTQHQWRLDIQPWLIEDMRQARQIGNRRPLETLIAFRMLDHLDPSSIDESQPPRFFTLPPTLREDAARDLDQLAHSDEAQRHEQRHLGTYALLLKLAELWLSDPQQHARNFSRLIDFAVFELERFAKLELSVAWDFLRRPNTPFFGPLFTPANELLKKLRGMAWDICHYRLLEALSARYADRGVFVPIAVSFDARLIQLLRARPIQVQIVDPPTRTAESIFSGYGELLVAVDEHVSAEARTALADVEGRLEKARRPLDSARVQQRVCELEKRVERLPGARRSAGYGWCPK